MKKLFKYLGYALLVAVLSSCGGSGTYNKQQDNGSLANLSVVAPDQYPAGIATTAYLTVINNSSSLVSNLSFDVPVSSNFTGTSVSVTPDSAQSCQSIPANGSCVLQVQIGSNSKTGSFKVVATSGNQVSGLQTKLKNLVGLNSQQFILTANIGLTDIPTNTQLGANGISFLYNPNVVPSSDGSVLISVVAVVNQNAGNNFNTIDLTTSNGTPLDFTVLSGNSGSGLTNLSSGSVVTFMLKIPSGASSPYDFYAKTLENGALVSQSNIANPVMITNSGQGVLVVQPTKFSLSASSNYISQILTYSNTGNQAITGLSIEAPQAPISIGQNDCTGNLDIGKSCNVLIISSAPSGTSGSGSVIANYTGGNSVISNYSYSGGDVQAGLTVSAVNNFNFAATTTNSAASTKLTIQNSGNVSESNFVISFSPNQYFSLSQQNGDTCLLSGNTVTNTLAGGSNCVLTLTYDNSTLSAGLTSMTINYSYGNALSNNIMQTLAWQTTTSGATLSVNPSSYYFGPIVANNSESKNRTFIITNNGPNSITAIDFQPIMGFSSYFTLESGGVGGCSSALPLANGATCTFKINFGPSSFVNPQITAILPIAYSYSSGYSSTSVALSGYTRTAISANIQLYNVTSSANSGNGESSNSAFQFESATATSKIITLSYQNTGQTSAQNFSISQAPSGYSILTNTCNNITLLANSANSCDVILQPSVTNAGNLNITLSTSTLYGAWSDERGDVGNQAILWSTANGTQNTIYANIYPTPVVTAVLSSESTGATPITQVTTNGSFYIVLTLSGGSNVNATYTVTSPVGFTPQSTTCNVTSSNPQCNVAITAPSTATSGANISITGGSGINVTPNSLTLNVVAPPSKTTYAYLSTGSTGIFQCSVSESDGMLNNCVKKGNPNPAPGYIVSLAMYPTGDYLYALTNAGSLPTDVGSYYACPIGQNGQYESATCGQKSFPSYGSLTFTSTQDTIYGYLAGQTTGSGGNQPNYCTISQESTLFCNTRSSYPTIYSSVVSSMIVNGSSYVYMSSRADSKVYVCDVTNAAGYNSPNCPNAVPASRSMTVSTMSNIQIGANYYNYLIDYTTLKVCQIITSGSSKGSFVDSGNSDCIDANPNSALANVTQSTRIATANIGGKPYLYAFGDVSGEINLCPLSTDPAESGIISVGECTGFSLGSSPYITTPVSSMVFGSY